MTAAPALSRILGRIPGRAAVVVAVSMLGACSQTMENLQEGLQSGLSSPADSSQMAKANAAAEAGKTELEKATEYWGKKFQEKPTDVDAAVSFAKNLKAMGARQEALAVIQQASVYNAGDKKLASEHGRLALELDQVSVAKQMLAIADDPVKPDWRVISARGTVMAKEGKFREAITFYERALTLSQEQVSVMNNLAMAYAMSGEANKAEEILRRAEAKGGNAKTRKNLSLVLGLQGKFDESKQIASKELGDESASADNDMLRRMIKTEKAGGWSPSTPAPASKAVAIDPDVEVATPVAAPSAPATAARPGAPLLKGYTR